MIRGLTLLQPWASAIAYGPKRVENRTWEPRPREVRDGLLVAIHAGKEWDKDPEARRAILDAAWPRTQRPGAMGWQTGAILAVARVARICWPYELRGTDQECWAYGPKCWVLEDVRALPEPLPCAGAQGLWRIPTTIHARLVDALGGSIGDQGGS